MIFKTFFAFVLLNALISIEANVLPEPETRNYSNSVPYNANDEMLKALSGVHSLCHCVDGMNSLECDNLKPLLADAKFYNVIDDYCRLMSGNASSLVVDSGNSSLTGYPSAFESTDAATSAYETSDINLSTSESPNYGKSARNASNVNPAAFGSSNDTLPDYPENENASATKPFRDGKLPDDPTNGSHSAANYPHEDKSADNSTNVNPSATRPSRDDKSLGDPKNGNPTTLESPRDGTPAENTSNVNTSASNFSKAGKPSDIETKHDKETSDKQSFFSNYFYVSAAVILVVVSAIAGYILGLLSRKKNIPPQNVNGPEAIPEPTFKMQFYRRGSFSFQ